MRHSLLKRFCAAAAIVAALAPAKAQKPVELEFYYPVVIGGPVTKIVESMLADFHTENADIRIQPIYAGSYQDASAKVLTAHRGGTPPQMAVLLTTDMYTLIDEDAIVPIDTLLRSDAERQWLDSFYDAFMKNSRTSDHVWGVPFQRSTLLLYYNKDLFKAAGLDPERAPATWDEQVSAAQKLTRRDAAGRVNQWGMIIPSAIGPYWALQALAIANDGLLANDAGTEVYFDTPAVVKALQYWHDLAAVHKVMPTGVIDSSTAPRTFLEQKAAMLWESTGDLGYIRANAEFPFGVAMMPSAKRRGSPTGGGNLYIFKNTTPEQQRAALRFVQWATQPERAAWWGIATGYVATSPAAWETARMRQYVADFPLAAVARDQLAVSVAEFSTHDNRRVTKALDDAIQSVLVGTKTPELALKDAQREADRLLRRFQK